MSSHQNFDLATQKTLDKLSEDWLKAAFDLLQFYFDIQKRFEALLTADNPESLQLSGLIRQHLAPVFFEHQTIVKIQERLDSLLELKFEIKKTVLNQPKIKGLGSKLVDISSRLVKLCELHLEFYKYQKNSLDLLKTATIVEAIRELNLRWQIFYAKLSTLQDLAKLEPNFQQASQTQIALAGLNLELSWDLDLSYKTSSEVENEKNQLQASQHNTDNPVEKEPKEPLKRLSHDSTSILTASCQTLGEIKSLFESIYGFDQAYFEIVFLQIILANPAKKILKCRIITSKAWQLALGSFLTNLLDANNSENKILKLAGDLVFLHKQTLKSPKRKLMAHQKQIQKALKLLPESCKAEVFNFDIETGNQNSAPSNKAANLSSLGADKTFNDKVTPKNQPTDSVLDQKKPIISNDLVKEPDKKINKNHVGFLTGG